MLKHIDHHLQKGEKKVIIRDYLENEHIYDLEIPYWCADTAYVLPITLECPKQILKVKS